MRQVRIMDGSVYKVIVLVGASPKSWEEAVQNVVATASKSLRDMRIAEVKELDVRLENGKIVEYRAKVKLSFKYEKEQD
ncbi:MAG: dodecin family protein [Methanotrichaceae archaeon]